MNNTEFINDTVGLPWVNRATGPDAYDCWGLVVRYYSEVLGIELLDIEGYASGLIDINDGYHVEREHWRQIDKPKDNCIFMAFQDGCAVHCGIVIGNHSLHCLGSNEKPGQVGYHSLTAIERMYKDIEFYEYRQS